MAPTITAKGVLAPLPIPERGHGFALYSSVKGWLAYGNGSNVVIRSQQIPSDAKVFLDHRANVNAAVFSPNGEYVASGDAQGQCWVWGTSNLKPKREEAVPVCNSINDLSWSGDGKRIAAAGAGAQGIFGRVFSWDSGSSLGQVPIHTKTVLSIDFKPQTPYYLVSSGEDHILGFAKGPPFVYTHKVQEHKNYPNKVAYSPDGTKIISVGSDGLILVLNEKGEVTGKLESKNSHAGAIYSFCWSPDNTRICTVGGDKCAKIWEVASGEVIATTQFPDKVDFQQMGCTWNEGGLYTVSLCGSINQIDPATGEIVDEIHGHGTTETFCTNGADLIFSGGADGRIAVWKDGKARFFSGTKPTKNVTGMALSKDGKFLYSIGLDNQVWCNKAETAEYATTDVYQTGAATCVGTGQKLAAIGQASNGILILEDGQPKGSISVKFKPLTVAFNNDDTILAVGGSDKRVHLFSVGDWKEVKEIKDHDGDVNTVAFGPDGRLCSSSADLTIRLYNNDYKQLNNSDWEFHKSAVKCHAWSPSGDKIATVSNDGNIFVWTDTVKGSTARAVQALAHKDGIISCAWLGDDLVTLGGDSCLRIWNITA